MKLSFSKLIVANENQSKQKTEPCNLPEKATCQNKILFFSDNPESDFCSSVHDGSIALVTWSEIEDKVPKDRVHNQIKLAEKGTNTKINSVMVF
jgi:hypothetical protein